MIRRKSLTEAGVASLKPRSARYTFPDPELRGHYVRVTPTGAKSYVALARDPDGKQVWATLGGTDLLTIDQARDEAREAIKRIREGLPAIPQRVKAETVEDVADRFLKRHVEKQKLRSQPEIKRLIEKHLKPALGKREFVGIRRSDVADLLDKIEDNHGPREADYLLAVIRKMMNWFAERRDDYVPPLARGMRRTDPKRRKRERILNDEELRKVWTAAEDAGKFGAIVRLALLTAQRKAKIAAMRWEDVSDGVWTMPTEDREKGVGGALKLPEAAREIIKAQARIGDNPYVFPGRGDTHFSGWSKCKVALDKSAPIDPWVVHDLRRTARSLMARAGVRPDIAERVMGHVIAGVEGVYDRHSYLDEKADALSRLAGLLAAILHPSDNVVPLERSAK